MGKPAKMTSNENFNVVCIKSRQHFPDNVTCCYAVELARAAEEASGGGAEEGHGQVRQLRHTAGGAGRTHVLLAQVTSITGMKMNRN